MSRLVMVGTTRVKTPRQSPAEDRIEYEAVTERKKVCQARSSTRPLTPAPGSWSGNTFGTPPRWVDEGLPSGTGCSSSASITTMTGGRPLTSKPSETI